MLVWRAPEVARALAKRPIGPYRHLTALYARILQKVASCSQREGGVLGNLVIGHVPTRVLEKGECQGGDVLGRASVDRRHELIVEQSVIPMTSKAIGIPRRLILQPPPDIHPLTVELIPHHVPHRLRHDLVRYIAVGRRHGTNRPLVRRHHRLPRPIHAQHLCLGWSVPIVPFRPWPAGGVVVKEWKVVRVHPQNVRKLVRDRQQTALVSLGGTIGGIHGTEAYPCVPDSRTIELIVLAVGGKGERLELGGRVRGIIGR
mmetsp:Transcript_12493/g.30540  ORF Transcript_12493/g.30540 Transcript_12493/m.30540 type:complete len:259 (-) Transcript_12493:880-1656(-)